MCLWYIFIKYLTIKVVSGTKMRKCYIMKQLSVHYVYLQVKFVCSHWLIVNLACQLYLIKFDWVVSQEQGLFNVLSDWLFRDVLQLAFYFRIMFFVPSKSQKNFYMPYKVRPLTQRRNLQYYTSLTRINSIYCRIHACLVSSWLAIAALVIHRN